MGIFFDELTKKLNMALSRVYIGKEDGSPYKIDELLYEEDGLIDLNHLQNYTEFLSKVPQNAYDEVTNLLAEMIMNVVFYGKQIQEDNQRIKNNKNAKEPKKLIKSDLATVKKFKTLINRSFNNSKFQGKNIRGYWFDQRYKELIFSKDGTIENKKKYNIDDLFEIIELMITDLTEEEFLLLPQENYREIKNPHSLNYYKTKLTELCKKYNLTDYSKNINDFINNFNITILKTTRKK